MVDWFPNCVITASACFADATKSGSAADNGKIAVGLSIPGYLLQKDLKIRKIRRM